jgi:hypothetical protein
MPTKNAAERVSTSFSVESLHIYSVDIVNNSRVLHSNFSVFKRFFCGKYIAAKSERDRCHAFLSFKKDLKSLIIETKILDQI